MAMDLSTSPGDGPITLGILLVHGIGEQRRSDTLVNWLDTLVATITRATQRRVSATVEWADLAGRDGNDDSMAQAVVRIRGDGVDERWVVVEGWWAEAFFAPAFPQLVGWSFRAVPWALAMHAAHGLHPHDGKRRGPIWIVAGVVRAILLLLLAPFILILLASLALLGLIPSDTLRTAIGRLQRTLAATAGDSLVLLESPARSAAMRSAVISAFATLERVCGAAGCQRRVVLAHSQGATVSLEALTQLARQPVSALKVHEDQGEASKLVFITFGAGINKLGALRWLSTHRLGDAGTGSGTDRRENTKTLEETPIDRDPVLSACLGLLAMAGVGLWFWRLVATGQLTLTQLWVIPSVWLAGSLVVGGLIELIKWLVNRYGQERQWLHRVGVWLVMTAFLGITIGGIAAAELTDSPVMPFFAACLLAMMVMVALRATLSKQVQDQITKTVKRPSNVDDWRDFWATADPVPNGATRSSASEWPISTRIWNEGSLLRDHTAYWENRDGFVLPVVRILTETAGSAWRAMLPPDQPNINRRSRWRVGWLRATRWPVAIATALATFQRAEELEQARGSAGNVMNAWNIAGWLDRVPGGWMPIGVLIGAVVLSAWIAHLIVEIVWRAWVKAEQNALLDHEPPSGTSPGLYAFATSVWLLFAGAVYLGRTDGATFRAHWQQATLGEIAVTIAGIAIWAPMIVWLVAKLIPPPGATPTAPSPPATGEP
jgi:hypothetical protein